MSARTAATQTTVASPLPITRVGPSLGLQRQCACGGSVGLTDVCQDCQKKRLLGKPLQTKLRINEPGDQYEQEADRVAEQVMAGPVPFQVNPVPSRIQRFTGYATGQTDAAPASVDRVLASSGRPLEPALRQDMEQRFGHDFSQVRVHSGAAAEQSARDVNANAYTSGHNIVLGAGRFAPETNDGKRLLAHELTHVVQQSGADGIRIDHSGEKRNLSPVSAISPKLGGSRVTPPIIQRKLVATGDPAGFAALVNSIITTQLRLNVDRTGRVSLEQTNVQGPPTREAQALTDALRRIISDGKTTTIAFIHGASSTDSIDQQVMIGSYAAARIDLDDLGALGSGEGISAGSALAHELIEQHRRQIFSEDYPTAHAAGMAEEEAVTGARRGASTRREIDATSYEIEVAYHYPDRTVFVTRVVRGQNIVAVRRRTTRP